LLLTVDPVIDLGDVTIDKQSYEDSKVLVQLNDGATADDITGILHNVEIVGLSNRSPGFLEVTLTSGITVDAAMAAYSGSQFVAYVEPNYRLQLTAFRNSTNTNDPLLGSLWGLNNTGQAGGSVDADIDATDAWSITTGSSSTIVAVIDTGVDYSHPDLAANMWVNTGEIAGNSIDDDGNGYVDDIYGYDFVNNDGDPFDDHSHGTHVSGTIAAVGNNGRGVTGVAWNASIMALKFLDASGSGYTSDAVRALDYAVANGANISNNSWGGVGYSQSMSDALARAQAAGHVFIAAAGNEGANNDNGAHYPANYTNNNVISVAATDRYDSLAYFSNYGATTVDIAAPGVEILSTTPNNNYSYYSGTSMATPHVSGVVALVMSQHPNWSYQQVIDQVLSNSDVLSSLQGKTITGGRLNAARAVGATFSDETGAAVVFASPDGLIAGNVSQVRLQFSESINASSFSTNDIVRFVGPNGSVSVNLITPVAGSNGREFDLSFAPQSTLGAYSLTVGPHILDLSGNAMDQDRDGTNGESSADQSSADQFTTSFTVSDLLVFGSNTPVPIRDLSTARSTITVNQDFLVSDVNVQLDVSHTWDSDLLITLTGPDGASVILSNHRGNDANHFSGTVFDDEAATPIALGQAPFSGSYRPDGILTSFDGQLSRGTWTLSIYDREIFDQGTLNNWSLLFDSLDIDVDLTGTWGANGRASSIVQTGTNLRFTNENGSSSNGQFTTSHRVFASNWNLSGTLDGTAVRWDNGSTWWQVPATHDNVAGNWTYDGVGTSIAQTGGFLVFFNENGQRSAGQFIAGNQVLASEWGLQGTINGDRVDWANSTSWQKALDNAPNLAGNWMHNGQGTYIHQTGSMLTFFNERGASSAGYFLSSTRIMAVGWGISGTVNGDRIDWDNGSIWQQGSPTVPNIAGNWNFNSRTTRIEQAGSALHFFNEEGAQSAGYFLGSNRVMATGWNIAGTIGANRIDWDNGSTWHTGEGSSVHSTSALLPPPTTGGVSHFVDIAHNGEQTEALELNTDIARVFDATTPVTIERVADSATPLLNHVSVADVTSSVIPTESEVDSADTTRLEANIAYASQQQTTTIDKARRNNIASDSGKNDLIERLFSSVDASLMDQLLFGEVHEERSPTVNRFDSPLT
jgi:subtilisin family serine protease/subtilisin-like proprotein convertase family protein